MSGRGARRGPAPGGHLARAPGSTTSPPPPGARPRAAASAPGATGVARATRGGSRTMAGGIAGPRPRPEAAASSSRPSRVAPSRTSADTSSRGIRSLLSRGVAIPPDVRPWQARRPSVPGDHFPVPGTTVSFPEFVIQPIAVILPTSQTYPILREFSGVSRKKKPPTLLFPFFPRLLRPCGQKPGKSGKGVGEVVLVPCPPVASASGAATARALGPVDKLLVPPSTSD